MKILITSGTGTVGSQVSSRLTAAGHQPIAMTHSLNKGGVYGDLNQPVTWAHALKNIDKVCLITPAMEGEGEQGAAFAKAAYEMGVQHIVFLGIHNVTSAATIPHFEAKIKVIDALKASNRPYTVIDANNFYQNDIWFLEALIASGNYLQPIGQIGLNRVDVRDIADAIVNALLETSGVHHFRSYPLVGPEPLTGEKTAALYSELLGREVFYPENCLKHWDELMSPFIPAWLMADWKKMYQHFIQNGLKASPLDLIQQQKILGNAPRKYENYVKELLHKGVV